MSGHENNGQNGSFHTPTLTNHEQRTKHRLLGRLNCFDVFPSLNPRVPEGGRKPETVIELFDGTCSACPNHPALKQEKDGKWVSWTYAEYQQDVKTAAKAFIKV